MTLGSFARTVTLTHILGCRVSLAGGANYGPDYPVALAHNV